MFNRRVEGLTRGQLRHFPLLIFPCNGNGVEALDCLGERYRCIGFVDDATEKQGSRLHGYPVFGRSALDEFRGAQVLAVPGSPASFSSRKEVIGSLGLNTDRLACIIHPSATVARLARIGHNVLIMAGVVITSNCTIGDHVCVLPNTVVHHDASVGDWSLIGSNVTVAGGTRIEENCYVGSGSSLKNGLKIGSGAMIGLGSNVVSDVPRGAVVFGNPARPVR